MGPGEAWGRGFRLGFFGSQDGQSEGNFFAQGATQIDRQFWHMKRTFATYEGGDISTCGVCTRKSSVPVNVQPKAPRATKIAKMDKQTHLMGALWDGRDRRVKGFLGDFSWGNAGGMRPKRRMCALSSAAGMAFRRSASRARGKMRVGGWAGLPARPGWAVRAIGEHRWRAIGEPLGEPWANFRQTHRLRSGRLTVAQRPHIGRAATTPRDGHRRPPVQGG